VEAGTGPVTIEPLRFADGALQVLDQRALPGEERWIRCETVEEVADCIRTLAVRGAPAIGLAAAYGMALAAPENRVAAAELLRSTRPTAVNLAWALEQCREAPDALAVARRLHREQDEADRRLAGLGAQLFAEGTRALTHCNAGALATGGYGTACGVLRAAWDSGRLAEVWVDETRPLLQGARLTAWELHQDGIPVEVITDSMAGHFFQRGEINFCVVGSDRIAANGDVANKIGTYTVAVLAKEHGVPFTVAAPWSTVDLHCPSGTDIIIEERARDEVARIGDHVLVGDGIHCRHPAFDVTPARLVTEIFTERGAFKPAAGETPGTLTGK
jgi:methylthioribose-1-phosphate isomerase